MQVPQPREFSTGYFPIRQFFLGQQQQFIQQGTGLEKTVLLEGKAESQVLHPADSADWYAELAVFFEANINKPAFVGEYKVDTLPHNTEGFDMKISYTATKPGLRVRWLNLYYMGTDTVPALLEAELFQQNMLYQSRQEIRFQRGKGYSIRGMQDVLLLGADSFAVDAVFVP